MIKRIGDFMLEIGTMKEYQVQEVIRVQKAGDNRLFGEIALEWATPTITQSSGMWIIYRNRRNE